jgi:Uma2 family endonuclease
MMQHRTRDDATEPEMLVSEADFRRLSLAEPNQWELYDGVPRRKPPMTFAHNELAWRLSLELVEQLGLVDWVFRVDAGLVRRSESRFFIPDLMVIPRAEVRRLFPDPHTWEVYPDPLPLVVEIWSPSTGPDDVTRKLVEYQRRGDLEIWLIHPVRRTLTAWRRQPDGSYVESVFSGGVVDPVALPNVRIDLDHLFRSLA